MLSGNGYGLVEQCQHRRPDRAGQRVESVHGVQAADIADGALAITGSLLDGLAQALELVCGELLICVENQQFATRNLGTRPFKATRLPRSASEVVSSFVFRLVFFVGCKKPRLKTASFRCSGMKILVLNWL